MKLFYEHIDEFYKYICEQKYYAINNKVLKFLFKIARSLALRIDVFSNLL